MYHLNSFQDFTRLSSLQIAAQNKQTKQTQHGKAVDLSDPQFTHTIDMPLGTHTHTHTHTFSRFLSSCSLYPTLSGDFHAFFPFSYNLFVFPLIQQLVPKRTHTLLITDQEKNRQKVTDTLAKTLYALPVEGLDEGWHRMFAGDLEGRMFKVQVESCLIIAGLSRGRQGCWGYFHCQVNRDD